MKPKQYKMRICIHGTKDKKRIYVSFNDDTLAMFTKPYVSVKRMQDRLAFMQWDTKTGQGFSAISNGMLRFSKQTDCEKMFDFCGEYNVVTKTDNGVVYVKLCDRMPLTTVVTNNEERAVLEDLVPERNDALSHFVPQTPSQSLADLLAIAIEKKQKELDTAQEEINVIKNGVLMRAMKRYEKINEELIAYCNAYNLAKESGDGKET